MLSSTVLAWFLVGFGLSVLVFVLESSRQLSAVAVVVCSAAVGGLSALLAWMFMTSFSYFLVSTWFHGLVVFLAAILLRVAFGDMKGSSIFVYAISVIVLLVSGIAASAPAFNAGAYGRLMVPEIKERDETVPLVDQTQARIVTDTLAKKRGAEILATATEQGLGSRVVMGEPWGNKVGDTMYWIMPLEHSGLGKWWANGTTPGYIAVSQMNEMNTKFVQDKPIRIGENAYGDDNIYRHLFNRGFKSYVMDTAIFQVDEEWNPYWVVPLSLPQVGMGGDMPVAWALVNATNGDVTIYDKESDVPAWVDRLYHQDNIADRFDDWGCWSQGASACMFSGNNVIKSAPGINVTIDANHDIVYYAGTQFENSQSEGATSGFYTANARTGKITFYRRAGITEAAAKAVMDGAFADFEGYHADDCVLLTINNEAAYFSIIVDGAGSRKGFALVLLKNRNVFGKGVSIQAALSDFSRSLQRAERDASFEPGEAALTDMSFEGSVLTLTPVVQGDRTSFYLTLDSLPGKILEVSEEKIGEIVVTKVGDRVHVTTDNDQPGVISTTSFDNLGFKLIEGPVQTAVDERNAAAKQEPIQGE